MPFSFDTSYAALPERFYAHVAPTPVRAPHLIRVNDALAVELGLDPTFLASAAGAAILAGNELPAGAASIAMAYAGHQFGGFVPQLGDGRAILLGEVVDRSGRRRDIQLKGPGQTPFSRRGDGRAALGPVLREYIVSEAMAALGIPTTRALAAVTTGEMVVRETMLPGAILTRVASSHIRVGTFQYFASRGDVAGLGALADHVIARHYPEAAGSERPYRALLEAVIGAQAELIAKWMHVGFIHGVMNTDNMSVAGETIDYGPCAFMDEYDPATVYSAIDSHGRYAYQNQPAIGEWNLARLAECFIPLLANDRALAIADATDALGAFAPSYEAAFERGMRDKLGLRDVLEDDPALVHDLLQVMQRGSADFTLTFRYLGEAATGDVTRLRSLFADPAAINAWTGRWRARLDHEPVDAETRVDAMRALNPAFIPRNHRIEAVIRAAVDSDDFAPFEELLTVLSRPFDDQPAFAKYGQPPGYHERVHQTFCGT